MKMMVRYKSSVVTMNLGGWGRVPLNIAGTFDVLLIILYVKRATLNLFSSERISKRLKYGTALSLLLAKNVLLTHLFSLVLILYNLVLQALPQLVIP